MNMILFVVSARCPTFSDQASSHSKGTNFSFWQQLLSG